MKVTLHDLHDATLLGVAFDWANGVVRLTLRTSRHGEVCLRVDGCTDLHVPKREEWGRSVSVMSAKLVEDDPDIGVEVEMQSGDRIKVLGRASLA